MRRVLAAVLGLLLLASAAPAQSRVHVVARGDTLGAIALRYKVSVPALVAANGLPGAHVKLKIGQRLRVPDKGAAPSTTTVRKGSVSPRTARNLREPRGPVNLVLAVPEFIDGSPLFLWPTDGPISSPFGRRRRGWHRGMDIKADHGAAVVAVAEGVVVASGVEPRYGRVVKIEHDDGFMSVYAHNDTNLVEVGDVVAAGDKIATIGRTGRATGWHLHFEIRRDGLVYNPLYMLPLPARVAGVEETDSEEEDE
ncbi:MAG TPA: LysM peptidoglycan-binding domain-containing M23 family metallopeptidase [Candidatus Limnocylindria bacterium]|nr:LysM peptidoglycan-binding domain-containing M23 family metallopeptidase [Candidatus Limnocylindria bacterium]